MDRKILFVGSIIAVAILIGVSFTSVVGYSKTKYNYVKASPLFNVRTRRAIDEEQGTLTCAYVGKGKGATVYIPTPNSRTALIKQLIDRIRKMDDKALNNLKVLFNNRFNRLNNVEGLNVDNPGEIINQLKTNPEGIENNVIHKGDDESLYTKGEPSYAECCTYEYDCPPPTLGDICTTLPFLCTLFAFIYLLILAMMIPITILIIIGLLQEIIKDTIQRLPSLILPHCS